MQSLSCVIPCEPEIPFLTIKKERLAMKISSQQFVGKELKRWREKKDLRAYEVAEMLEISGPSLSGIENGEYYPRFTTLVAIHIYTDIDVLKLMTNRRQ